MNRDLTAKAHPRRVLTLLLCGALAAGVVRAGIFHDAASDVLIVTDFPAEAPCTLERLRTLDARGGWGRVAYDTSTDTYTLSCGLRIGANDGTETYFQIGSAAHPRETLVMAGDLVVYPYAIKGENRDATWVDGYGRIQQRDEGKRINRLTLGEPGDAAVTPALKFVCAKPGEVGLSVGRAGAIGGQFHAYHALLTAAVPQPEHAFNVRWDGDSVILDGTTVSWVASPIGIGMPTPECRIANCVFEHAAAATYNGDITMSGCTLRHLDAAVSDAGGLRAILTDCVFADNERNYRLPHTPWGLTCIDCTFGVARQPDLLRAWRPPGADGAVRYPSFRSQRHIIVEVTDAAGAPVPNARVVVTCEQGVLDAVEHGNQTTDATGRTPGRGGEQPVLLTEVLRRATDNPDQPEQHAYTFTVAASAPGRVPAAVKGFAPVRSWDTVRVVLATVR